MSLHRWWWRRADHPRRMIIKHIPYVLAPRLASTEVCYKMDKLGVLPRPGTPGDFGSFLAGESEKWNTVAKNANIQIAN